MRLGDALIRTCIACSVFAACGREGGAGGDSAAVATAAAPATGSGTDSSTAASAATVAPRSVDAPTCVSEGMWQACSVEKRLTDAGFVPVRKGAAPTGVFGVAGTTYTLGPAELNVYLFRSARERETAVAAIDSVGVVRRGAAPPWPMAPTLITSNNLVAVLLSDNGRLIERVQNAITAGLPSAAR